MLREKNKSKATKVNAVNRPFNRPNRKNTFQSKLGFGLKVSHLSLLLHPETEKYIHVFRENLKPFSVLIYQMRLPDLFKGTCTDCQWPVNDPWQLIPVHSLSLVGASWARPLNHCAVSHQRTPHAGAPCETPALAHLDLEELLIHCSLKDPCEQGWVRSLSGGH